MELSIALRLYITMPPGQIFQKQLEYLSISNVDHNLYSCFYYHNKSSITTKYHGIPRRSMSKNTNRSNVIILWYGPRVCFLAVYVFIIYYSFEMIQHLFRCHQFVLDQRLLQFCLNTVRLLSYLNRKD